MELSPRPFFWTRWKELESWVQWAARLGHQTAVSLGMLVAIVFCACVPHTLILFKNVEVLVVDTQETSS